MNGVSSKQLNGARIHFVPRAGKRKGEAILVPVHGGETLFGGELEERFEDGVFVRVAVVVVDDVNCGAAESGKWEDGGASRKKMAGRRPTHRGGTRQRHCE